jgi:hypothetical protein
MSALHGSGLAWHRQPGVMNVRTARRSAHKSALQQSNGSSALHHSDSGEA